MSINENDTLGTIVANNISTSKVFDKYGLDYCCGGEKTLQEVCVERNIDIMNLIEDLNNGDSLSNGVDYNSWPLDLLIDYIEKKHHRYVREETPLISERLVRLCHVHGDKHPELHQIKQLFEDSGKELFIHMQKEETILFPYIRNLVGTKGVNPAIIPFGSLKNPIAMMKKEHEFEGERFNKIREISNQYTCPKDGCNTYLATFQLLKDFERDLHLHIHLENNILFPKAIKLEAKNNKL